MSDQKLLHASSSNDLAWFGKMTDVSDFGGCVGDAHRKMETLPVSDWIALYQIRYEKAVPPRLHWLILDDHEERGGDQVTVEPLMTEIFLIHEIKLIPPLRGRKAYSLELTGLL